MTSIWPNQIWSFDNVNIYDSRFEILDLYALLKHFGEYL